MPGAEGKSCFDLDADFIERYEGAIVRAVNDKAAGRDRLQYAKTLPDPILSGDALELQRSARRSSCRLCRQGSDRFLVRGGAKMKRQAPAFAAPSAKSPSAKMSATRHAECSSVVSVADVVSLGVMVSWNMLKDRWFLKSCT